MDIFAISRSTTSIRSVLLFIVLLFPLVPFFIAVRGLLWFLTIIQGHVVCRGQPRYAPECDERCHDVLAGAEYAVRRGLRVGRILCGKVWTGVPRVWLPNCRLTQMVPCYGHQSEGTTLRPMQSSWFYYDILRFELSILCLKEIGEHVSCVYLVSVEGEKHVHVIDAA